MSPKPHLSNSPVIAPFDVEWVPIESVIKNARAARTHQCKKIEKLAKLIAANRVLTPLVVDGHLNLLAGHAKLDACNLLGLREPLIYSHSGVFCV